MGGPVFEGFRTKGVQSVAVCSLRVSVYGGGSLSSGDQSVEGSVCERCLL